MIDNLYRGILELLLIRLHPVTFGIILSLLLSILAHSPAARADSEDSLTAHQKRLMHEYDSLRSLWNDSFDSINAARLRREDSARAHRKRVIAELDSLRQLPRTQVDSVEAARVWSEKRRQGVEQAKLDFEADLASNTLAWCYIGGIKGAWMQFDTTTGLPGRMVAGCVVTAYNIAYISTYNGLVEDWININGYPANSRKPAIERWGSASNFFSARTAADEMVAVKQSERGFNSKRGLWNVQIRPADTVAHRAIWPMGPSGWNIQREWLIVLTVDGDTALSTAIWSTEADQREIAWGPEGSDLLGLRWRRLHITDNRPDTTWVQLVFYLRGSALVLDEIETASETRATQRRADMTNRAYRIRDSLSKIPDTVYAEDGRTVRMLVTNPYPWKPKYRAIVDSLLRIEFPPDTIPHQTGDND